MIEESKKIHFVSMDVPFPPNYGGIIDVFYKLKAFHQLGVKVYLHVYGSASEGIEDLKQFAEEVYYYPIKKNPFYFLNPKPFSVKSRNGKALLKNIKKVKAPIFFESFRTTDFLSIDELNDYPKYLRLHNIEQKYFEGLANSESDKVKQMMYNLESNKYVKYEQIISKMDEVFTLSKAEQDYTFKKYKKGKFIPVFHGNETLPELEDFGKFVLYHGDLRIADNCKVVEYLIDVFKESEYPLVIASSIKEEWVKGKINAYQNIKFVKLKNFSHLLELFQDAHINIAWSFQESGTKLKVVNALFNSRFSVINKNIIDDEKIASLCYEANNTLEILHCVDQLMQKPFKPNKKYKEILENYLNDKKNAELILKEIFKVK